MRLQIDAVRQLLKYSLSTSADLLPPINIQLPLQPYCHSTAALLPLQVSSGFRQRHGSLMHVALDSAEVLLVVRGTDAASRRAAVALIQEADPASTGVPMRDVHQIHLDVKLNGGTVHFATNLKASPCLDGVQSTAARLHEWHNHAERPSASALWLCEPCSRSGAAWPALAHAQPAASSSFTAHSNSNAMHHADSMRSVSLHSIMLTFHPSAAASLPDC